MDENKLLPELILPAESRDNCRGPPSARYSLVEYGDYTSERCRNVLSAVNELVRELGDDLCFVYRNFPETQRHPRARATAEAAEAAGLQGKFWLMHDRLFLHQEDFSDRAIREIASSLPLDVHHFEREIASGAAARRVDEDLESAKEAGVGDTPTFFVNGRLHVGEHEFLPLLKALQAPRSK
jgi:NhaA family Na+:H+ antiporter